MKIPEIAGEWIDSLVVEAAIEADSLCTAEGINMKELIFYYDVICPYAYLASRLIEGIADAAGAKIRWKPVLLGGIYKATKPESEKNTKAYEAMSSAKQLVLGKDLLRLYTRYNVPFMPVHKMPDLSTLKTMRLLAACKDETSEERKTLTHSLYHALWAEKKDVSDVGLLQKEVAKINWDIDVNAVVSGENPVGKNALFANTEEAVNRGAFGVPSFWVNNTLYFGCDRFHFVERELGVTDAQPHRLLAAPIDTIKRKLRIFHDFASPWCFVTHRHMPGLIKSISQANVEIEWVPVLLGALFNAIGTRHVPMLYVGENKRAYGGKDLNDWLRYLMINDFKFPGGFPHNSLTALRMTIANPDDKLRMAFYDAAWTKDIDIGENSELETVVQNAGFDAMQLFNSSNDQKVKDKLRENTEQAISLGCCGVPSFQVDDQPVIWGQDRLNIIADELCGWEDTSDESLLHSKL